MLTSNETRVYTVWSQMYGLVNYETIFTLEAIFPTLNQAVVLLKTLDPKQSEYYHIREIPIGKQLNHSKDIFIYHFLKNNLIRFQRVANREEYYFHGTYEKFMQTKRTYGMGDEVLFEHDCAFVWDD